MDAVGNELGVFMLAGALALRPNVRRTLPSRRLPQFLVLDFRLRTSVRHHRAVARGPGRVADPLLLYIPLDRRTLDRGSRRYCQIVLESRGSPPCRLCLRIAGVFFRGDMSQSSFQAALFHSGDARGCHLDRSRRYLSRPLAHGEVHFSMAARSSGDSVCGRMDVCDLP